MRELTFSREAERDIDLILDWSIEQFGNAAAARYAALIYHCCELLRVDPIGQSTSPGEASGIRLLHLKAGARSVPRSVGRVKHPRHFIVFRVLRNGDLEITRVLHDRMDLERFANADSPTDE